MKAIEWIDRVKTARGWESDYRVAQELGLTRSSISLHRSRGNTTLDEEAALKIADILHERPEVILIDQAAERAKTEEARSVYRGLLGRLGGIVTTVSLSAAVFVAATSVPTSAQAQKPIEPGCILCKIQHVPKLIAGIVRLSSARAVFC